MAALSELLYSEHFCESQVLIVAREGCGLSFMLLEWIISHDGKYSMYRAIKKGKVV